MTLDDLAAYGADVNAGMTRCMNNEGFYLRLVDSVKQEERFVTLRETIEAGDLDAAFEIAHSLKGVLGNLALTPMYEPVQQITELLRGRENVDYSDLLNQIDAKREEFLAL
jgi:HPt (histidine-containing phosphotransfer) domain-containing protein